MLKIFAGYYYASCERGAAHTAFVTTAYSLDEATGFGMTACYNSYPMEYGFWGHHASFVEVPESMIQNCLKYR